MKKFFLMLGLSTLLLVNAAFADSDDVVNPKIRKAFHTEFVQAREVSWEKSGNMVKAVFKLNDKFLTAYYTPDGEMLGAARNLLSTELPINLQVALKKDYANYWISDLFEFARQDESGYYVTLQNADEIITLQSTDGSNWSNFRKSKK